MESKKDVIVLVGMMGTGKSTVGAYLAAETGYRLLDLDALVAAEAGLSIPRLFEEKGELYFRDLETRVLCETLKERGAVLATGGGAVLRPENCREMLARGWVVALQATPEEILARVGEDPNRPLLAGGAKARIAALLEERKHAYDFADVTINTTGKSAGEVSAEILMHYRG